MNVQGFRNLIGSDRFDAALARFKERGGTTSPTTEIRHENRPGMTIAEGRVALARAAESHFPLAPGPNIDVLALEMSIQRMDDGD